MNLFLIDGSYIEFEDLDDTISLDEIKSKVESILEFSEIEIILLANKHFLLFNCQKPEVNEEEDTAVSPIQLPLPENDNINEYIDNLPREVKIWILNHPTLYVNQMLQRKTFE